MGMFRALIRSAVGRLVEITSSDSLFSPGGFRTRSGNTGGGDIYTRNVIHGPSGDAKWADSSGDTVGGMGVYGGSLVIYIGETLVDSITVNTTTGAVDIPVITSTTQSPGDGSTKVATTEYADDAAQAALDEIKPGSITLEFGYPPGLLPSPSVIPTQVRYVKVPADYVLTGWMLQANAAVTVSVDVRYHTAPSLPTGSDSMTNSHPLTLTGASNNTGTVSGWSATDIDRGNWIAVAITANDAATWLVVHLQGVHG